MTNRTLFNRDFSLVAAGQVVSIFGNQILRYALPLYLLNLTGSAALFGAVMAVSFVPMLILFPIGGVLADRVNKRNIMVALDFATAALVAAFTLLAGHAPIVPLMAATMVLLYAIQGAYQPAVQASVPVLVDEHNLTRANAVVNLINSAASMAGPVIGGVLYAAFGLGPILVVSAGCFAVSAVMELFIRIPHQKRDGGGNIFATGLGDLKESLRFMLRGRPALFKAALLYAGVNLFLCALIIVAVPVIVTGQLGLEPDTANRLYGFAQGAIAAGAVAGGLLAGVLAGRLKPGIGPVLVAGCALAVLVAGIGLRLLPGAMGAYLVLVAGSCLLVGLSTIFQIQMLSCIQRLTPAHLTGKVLACFTCIAMAASPLGQLVYGFVYENIGGALYLPFYIAGGIVLCMSVCSKGLFAGLGSEGM